MKSSLDIRKDFIEFFKSRNHSFVRGTPLFLPDDPTLLFTNAGMNQFKPIFLGNVHADTPRAVNSQRCMRVSGKHNDLEEVGFSPHHHTLFEMLGNWSFGDYYKKEAIEWAWELLTDVWKLPKDKLWVTVFKDDLNEIPADEEAAEIWQNKTDVKPEHIRFFGRKDNFWEMGETGPCGPCTEIHMDRGIEFCDKQDVEGHVCSVNGDCRRIVELWNLVFIQYNRIGEHELKPLPSRHVDTGMGLERVTAVMQDVSSNYDTDLFMPIIQAVKDLSGQSDEDYQKNRHAYRVIADHVRASSFLLTDGVLPSNEWRGYVLRRIIRRAVRFGTKIGFKKPFLCLAAETFIREMSPVYPELSDSAAHIISTLRSEEKRFFKTLNQGLPLVTKAINKAKKAGQSMLSGKTVFTLYDTFGFPIDITREIVEEADLTINEQEFEDAMNEQRDRARNAWKAEEKSDHSEFWHSIANKFGNRSFIGYETTETNTHVKAIIQNNQLIDRVEADSGQFHVLLEKSPFYAESGGQTSDTGILQTDSGIIKVVDCQNMVKGLPVLICEIQSGSLSIEESVKASVDSVDRIATARNHTATHLLHYALRNYLGDHVKQSGSLVNPKRLRFDFTHFEGVTSDELNDIEQIVNKIALQNLPVTTDLMSLDEALQKGVIALFGEKYDENVRVVKVGDASSELCGGTHVKSSGEIGLFKIVSESSVAAGVRRIEAITGLNSFHEVSQWESLIGSISKKLKVPDNKILEKTEKMQTQIKDLQKEIYLIKSEEAKNEIESKLQNPTLISGIPAVIHHIPGMDNAQLRDLADQIRHRLGTGIAVILTSTDSKVFIVVAVTSDLKNKLHAGKIVSQIATIVGGGGGGRPDMAQAGGTKPEMIDQALEQIPEIIKNHLV